jgi:lysophospholipase L1-like esterase
VRFDGTKLSTFVNGVKLQECSPTSMSSARNLRYCFVNATTHVASSSSGFKIGLSAIYMRGLNDGEVQNTHKFLIANFGAVGVNQILGVTGTSISAFLPSAYSDMVSSPGLSPLRLVTSQAFPSQTSVSAITDQAPYLDAVLTIGPPQAKYVLFSELGTNDLLANANVTTAIANIAAYLDSRRAAGWQKIVQSTIMSRNDAGMTGGGMTEAQFDTARATVNTAIHSWVGTRIDAVADYAADPTMGTGCNNLTYFWDGVHPTAAGNLILAPIVAAAVNSV